VLKCAASLEERFRKSAVWQPIGATADGLFSLCEEFSSVYWAVTDEGDGFVRDFGTAGTLHHIQVAWNPLQMYCTGQVCFAWSPYLKSLNCKQYIIYCASVMITLCTTFHIPCFSVPFVVAMISLSTTFHIPHS